MYKHSLNSVLRKRLPAFMARSSTKAAGESDVTAAGEKTLDFDDVTLRGEKKKTCYSQLILLRTPSGPQVSVLNNKSP